MAVDFGGNHFLSVGGSVGGGFPDIIQAAVVPSAAAPGFYAAAVARSGPRVDGKNFAAGLSVIVFRNFGSLGRIVGRYIFKITIVRMRRPGIARQLCGNAAGQTGCPGTATGSIFSCPWLPPFTLFCSLYHIIIFFQSYKKC